MTASPTPAPVLPPARVAGAVVRRRVASAYAVAALGLACLGLAACAPTDDARPTVPPSYTTSPPTSPPPATEAPTTPSTAPTTTEAPRAAVPVRPELAALAVSDDRVIGSRYVRSDWKHFVDIDGDGCDARQQSLRLRSTETARMGRSRCKVDAGRWPFRYQPGETTDPAALEIDHVVSLADAHRSGGFAWSPEQRRQFANDQDNLLPVSIASNQAKSDKTPVELLDGRIVQRSAWCEYATTYVKVKAKYRAQGMTVTTADRDALGRMLETC